MSGWFTPAQMTAIRNIVKIGMVTPVTIQRRSVNAEADPSNIYGTDAETWTTVATVNGWLYETTSPTNITVISGKASYIMTYRLFMPVGTDIDAGYRAVIGGITYVVEDAAQDDTWQPMKRCTLRRRE